MNSGYLFVLFIVICIATIVWAACIKLVFEAFKKNLIFFKVKNAGWLSGVKDWDKCVKVQGEVQNSEKVEITPFMRKDSIFFKYSVRLYRRYRGGWGFPRVMKEGESQSSVSIKDTLTSQLINIIPRDADLDLKTSVSNLPDRISRDKEVRDKMERGFSEIGYVAEKNSYFSGVPLKNPGLGFTEIWIEAKQKLFVCGKASKVHRNGKQVVVFDANQDILIITDKSEFRYLAGILVEAAAKLIFSILLLLFLGVFLPVVTIKEAFFS